MTGAVLSYSESPDLAGEVAAAGQEVAKMLGAEAVSLELDEVSPGLLTANKVVLVKGELPLEAIADSAAAGILELVKARGFGALLIAETRFGTIVAAKVAARLRVGSLGKGKKLRVDEGRLVIERDVYGGRFTATVASRLPCVAVVQAGAYEAADASPGPAESVAVTVGEPKVAITQTKQGQQGEAGIKSALKIVSAGRGFARKEDLVIAQDLASALGASLGCSRPLSSDLGWMGEEAHIGLTGAYVHPQLYVAIGISGQLQHVAGIKDSKVIVAINKDAHAPIFQVADYGIVGDLYEVVPALTKALKQG
ncbi:MAG: electron transfer flavoprotein subunit alpha/FixB family protein [Thaumarchaeota archaeon]|nr:electron transfer flavoprotein subunit alpha/FixB family protein [Nitrososphaerota archaeon]